MLRKHENSDSWKAGILAIGVHAVLLVAMLISFNWKAAHTVLNVTEVELWDKIPKSNPPEIKVEPKLIIEEKPEPKPEPKPIVEEKPKPEEPKVDIELEKKKKELEKKEQEQKLKELEDQRKKEALDKLKQEAREDELREKKAVEKKNKDALKKLQQEALSDENAAGEKQASAASSAANAGIIKGFTDKMADKIRGNITSGLCGDGNPVLKVNIDILPTGQIRGSARITKSSENQTCDDAVERAILASEPFQLPEDSKLKAEFRDMLLTFKPND
jgi:colicin import membrane protein